MSNREIKSRLIKLAAQMACREGMPSYYRGDWDLPRSTSRKTFRKIAKSAEIAQDQSRIWAIELKKIIDNLD